MAEAGMMQNQRSAQRKVDKEMARESRGIYGKRNTQGARFLYFTKRFLSIDHVVDQHHGGSRSTSRSGMKTAHESDQVTRGEREKGWLAFDYQEQQEASSSSRVLQRPLVRVPPASTAIRPKTPMPKRQNRIGIWICFFWHATIL